MYQISIEEKGKRPCIVCKKGVGNNSILCISCRGKFINDVKGSMYKAFVKLQLAVAMANSDELNIMFEIKKDR